MFKLMQSVLAVAILTATAVVAQNELTPVPTAIDRSLLFEAQMPMKEGSVRPTYRLPADATFGIDDWQLAIDTTWGPGLDATTEWAIYKAYWEAIDQEFVCFNGITVDWDSIRAADSAEIAGGVSRGRFIAIMQYAAWELSHGQTTIYDSIVNYDFFADPGKPCMFTGDWGNCAHFGAGVTLGLDGSLFVYQVGEGHPMGLEPGDLILGYDGVPWEEMYPQLLEYNVPLQAWAPTASTPASREHRMMSAVGRNWHMFDTLDVVTYSTGDTVHLPTNLMLSSTAYTANTEQLDQPGVSKPDWNINQYCTWGIIDGTTIGYIYVYYWGGNADTLFYNAVDSLMNHHTTTGIIIDYRLDFGGSMFSMMDGLSLLFDDTLLFIDWYLRSDANDHFALSENSWPPSTYQIPGNPGSAYNKPIAVLIGLANTAVGEWASLALSFHPRAKFFGKQTDAMCSYIVSPAIHSSFKARYAYMDPYLVSNPGMPLSRRAFPNAIDFPTVPYEEVWLTRDGVAQGIDDVVEAAIAWINSGCCIGLTGNVDDDLSDGVDIGDLTALIGYLFIPPFDEPSCLDEANVDGAGTIDIGDLTALISYLFIPPFTEPAACQ